MLMCARAHIKPNSQLQLHHWLVLIRTDTVQQPTGWKIFIFFLPLGLEAFSILPLMPTSSPVFSSAAGTAVVAGKAVAEGDGPAAVVSAWTLAWLTAGLGSALRTARRVAGGLLVSAPVVKIEGLVLWAFLPVQLGHT